MQPTNEFRAFANQIKRFLYRNLLHCANMHIETPKSMNETLKTGHKIRILATKFEYSYLSVVEKWVMKKNTKPSDHHRETPMIAARTKTDSLWRCCHKSHELVAAMRSHQQPADHEFLRNCTCVDCMLHITYRHRFLWDRVYREYFVWITHFINYQ